MRVYQSAYKSKSNQGSRYCEPHGVFYYLDLTAGRLYDCQKCFARHPVQTSPIITHWDLRYDEGRRVWSYRNPNTGQEANAIVGRQEMTPGVTRWELWYNERLGGRYYLNPETGQIICDNSCAVIQHEQIRPRPFGWELKYGPWLGCHYYKNRFSGEVSRASKCAPWKIGIMRKRSSPPGRISIHREISAEPTGSKMLRSQDTPYLDPDRSGNQKKEQHFNHVETAQSKLHGADIASTSSIEPQAESAKGSTVEKRIQQPGETDLLQDGPTQLTDLNFPEPKDENHTCFVPAEQHDHSESDKQQQIIIHTNASKSEHSEQSVPSSKPSLHSPQADGDSTAQLIPDSMKQKKLKIRRPPSRPPTPDPYDQLKTIMDEFEPLRQGIEKFSSTTKDKEFLYLQDKVDKLIIRIDRIDPTGDDRLRQQRRDATQTLLTAVEELESKVSGAHKPQPLNAETNDEE